MTISTWPGTTLQRCDDIGCTEHPGDDPYHLREDPEAVQSGPGGQEHLHTIPPKRERTARQPQPRGDRAKRDPGRPPELTAADRHRMADEYALDGGRAWQAGDVAKAARLVRLAAELDPSRAELWAGRQQQIQDRAARMPLAAQTAARLAAAGVTPDDPAYQRICEHNRLRREAVAQASSEADTSPEATP